MLALIPMASHGDSAKGMIDQDLFITKRLHDRGANLIYFGGELGKLWDKLGYLGGELQRAELTTGRTGYGAKTLTFLPMIS